MMQILWEIQNIQLAQSVNKRARTETDMAHERQDLGERDD